MLRFLGVKKKKKTANNTLMTLDSILMFVYYSLYFFIFCFKYESLHPEWLSSEKVPLLYNFGTKEFQEVKIFFYYGVITNNKTTIQNIPSQKKNKNYHSLSLR